MKCANPNCQSTFLYVKGGTLRLMELECHPGNGLSAERNTLHSSTPTSRYFWLCRDCARVLVLKRWTPTGLILQSRYAVRDGKPGTWTVKANPAVETSAPHFQSLFPRSA